MKLLVCGSRDYTDKEFMWQWLDNFHIKTHIDVLIEGEAPGADSLARDWAALRHIPVEKYPADWSKYGRAAGPIRNKQMLVEGKPDKVVGFVNKPLSESRGTKNMISQASEAGIETYVLERVNP